MGHDMFFSLNQDLSETVDHFKKAKQNYGLFISISSNLTTA